METGHNWQVQIKEVSVGDKCDGESMCDREMTAAGHLLPGIQNNIIY